MGNIKKRKLNIRQATKKDASNSKTTEHIVNIVNQAYNWSESEQWVLGKKRTAPQEIRTLLATQKLLLASFNDILLGVVQVEEVLPRLAGFGMLSVDQKELGNGIGASLVEAAENWAKIKNFTHIEIEIVRAEIPNKHKQFLDGWYKRLGYFECGTYPIAARIPEIAPFQRQNCLSTIYRKRLQ